MSRFCGERNPNHVSGVGFRRLVSPRVSQETFSLPSEGALRVAVVADTHGKPHPMLDARLTQVAPHRVLHAGDIGALSVLSRLAKHAPVTAVRGNIDGRAPDLPDFVTITISSGEHTLLRLLLTHIAVNGPKLRADVLRRAKSEDATLVVCGHSHVPFATHDRGVTVFNPGSVGPRRFQLPIVFGVIEIGKDGVAVRHVDCETGLRWRPRSG